MTTSDENAALARRYLADVVAGNDEPAVEAFLADDVRLHDPVFERSHRGWPIAGSDIEVAVFDVIATEERVAVRGQVRSSSTPGGDPYEVATAWFCRIQNGRIAELWTIPDALGLARQVGTDPRDAIPRTERNTTTDSDT